MKKSEEKVLRNAAIITALAVAALLAAPLIIKGTRKEPEPLRVECVDGHKFVVYSGGVGGGVSQMLTLDEKGSLVPAMCVQRLTP